jgi:hypothetical protein
MTSEEEDMRIKFEINDWDLNNEFNPSRAFQRTKRSKDYDTYGEYECSLIVSISGIMNGSVV